MRMLGPTTTTATDAKLFFYKFKQTNFSHSRFCKSDFSKPKFHIGTVKRHQMFNVIMKHLNIFTPLALCSPYQLVLVKPAAACSVQLQGTSWTQGRVQVQCHQTPRESAASLIDELDHSNTSSVITHITNAAAVNVKFVVQMYACNNNVAQQVFTAFWYSQTDPGM